jgi:hypothetical protein
MAQEKPIANLSEQLNKIRESFRQLKNVSSSLDETVGNSNATGMAAVSNNIWKSILSYFRKFPEIFFGKSSSKNGQKSSNWADYGIAYLTALLASLDLCSIINTIGNLTENLNGAKFNPNENPPPNDFKWKVQKTAYEIQVSIDLFNRAYSLSANPGFTISTFISSVSPNIQRLTSQEYLGSEDMRKAFPQVDQMNNWIIDTLSDWQNNNTISNTDNKKISKRLKAISLLRSTCILIQGLSTPANFSRYALSAVDSSTYDTIDKIGKDNLDPKKLGDTIGSIQSLLIPINKSASFILKYIQYLQFIVKVTLTLVKIFRILINFFILLPIPNMVTTTGVTTGLSKSERKLDEYLKNMIKILSEINLFISMIVSLLRGLTAVIDQILSDLEIILQKFKNCTRVSDNTNTAEADTIRGLEVITTDLKNTNQSLKNFISNYDSKKDNNNKTYEGYTIEIRIEDVSDQNVLKTALPRRYGIAIDGSGIQAVRSDYTFASDDSVIINQVKLLLTSKGLIKPQEQLFTNEQLKVLNEAMAAIEDNSISMEDIPQPDSLNEYIDMPDNENENDGLGLNAFVNKLSGGKRLRKRIKENLAKSREKLNSDLNSVKNNR